MVPLEEIYPHRYWAEFEKQFNFLKDQNTYLKKDILQKDEKLKNLSKTSEAVNDTLITSANSLNETKRQLSSKFQLLISA